MLTMQEDAMLKAFDKLVPYSEVATLSTLLQSEDDTPDEVPAKAAADAKAEDIPAAAL